MKIKTITLVAMLLFCSIFTFGQKNEFSLIKLDSTWGQEVLRFPGRNINYKGVAEVRFPPEGWRDINHKNFWSYTYAWEINLASTITAKEVAENLEKYFNSLNHIEMDATTDPRYASASVHITSSKQSTTFFKGAVKTYDRFATHKNITLNVLIESILCEKEKKTIMLFKFSPKEFDHETWQTTLSKISFYDDLCDE